MKIKNEMTLVDIGCGELIPRENLNTNSPGSVGSMIKSLNNAYSSSNTFKASTTYGFSPGFTIDGKNNPWGSATFNK